jgi:hypothetical protein
MGKMIRGITWKHGAWVVEEEVISALRFVITMIPHAFDSMEFFPIQQEEETISTNMGATPRNV